MQGLSISPRSLAVGLMVGLAAIAMTWTGIKGGLILLMVPPVIIFVIVGFQKPEIILFSATIMAFLVSLLSRYISDIPFGLVIDALLLLLTLVLIFHKKIKSKRYQRNNILVFSLLAWLLFSLFLFLNPQALSKVAGLYANRGLSFYPVLFVCLTIHTMKKGKYMQHFIILWAILSILGTIWGIKQLFLGVSLTEQQWLNHGAANTHILFGKLRVFSYFSDSAQFGANQAHTALVFGIIGIFSGKMPYKPLYLIVSALSLYGMLISGTRGVLAILAVGGITYLLMVKNFRIIILGLLFSAGLFSVLKYTSIGQSYYHINRIRTALDFDDPSFRVRRKRIQMLSEYLADKPFGGGIGSAGFWGKRFSPGTFLAEIGTDGHYTRIWMETGKIGLYLYLMMLISIIIYLGRMLWHMKTSRIRQVLLAFYCGFVGLCAASYTNGLITQLPTGILVFTSLGLIFLGVKNKWSIAS